MRVDSVQLELTIGSMNRQNGLHIGIDSDKVWYKNNQWHRPNGPAMLLRNGDKYWYHCGLCHRIGNPAVELNCGNYGWYEHDLCHRLDGPAVEQFGWKEWYYQDNYIKCNTQEEFERLIKLKILW